jgi:hypothetical protein
MTNHHIFLTPEQARTAATIVGQHPEAVTFTIQQQSLLDAGDRSGWIAVEPHGKARLEDVRYIVDRKGRIVTTAEIDTSETPSLAIGNSAESVPQ